VHTDLSMGPGAAVGRALKPRVGASNAKVELRCLLLRLEVCEVVFLWNKESEHHGYRRPSKNTS